MCGSSACRSNGRSGSLNVMLRLLLLSPLLTRDAGKVSRSAARARQIVSLALPNRKAGQLGLRIVPFGLDAARLAIVEIGFLDVAGELVGDAAAVIGQSRAARLLGERRVEQGHRL